MSVLDVRFLKRGGDNQPILGAANEKGEQLVAFGMPQHAEETRKGNRYATMATAAVAALVVRPTTTAAFEIYNNTGSVPFNGSACNMVITRLFTHWLVQSTTALGSGCSIYAMVGTQVRPTDAGLAITSLSGKPNLAAAGCVFNAASQTVVDLGWYPYGTFAKHESAGAVVPGGALEAQVDGRLIVPPGAALSIHVVSGYTADTFTSGAEWVFEPLTMG